MHTFVLFDFFVARKFKISRQLGAMEGILFSSNTTWGSTPEITAFYELIGTKHVLTRETTQPKLYKPAPLYSV